ncbi:hypothetical protein WJX72_004449 [[Myrmecia] bisecta]|uniref:Glycosyltransferase 61 catalytic domain-containing protein n=1 Tax=[Myrmecia] bisecta TaxID=41462 RepID=A0AAW1PUA7_9CHLO
MKVTGKGPRPKREGKAVASQAIQLCYGFVTGLKQLRSACLHPLSDYIASSSLARLSSTAHGLHRITAPPASWDQGLAGSSTAARRKASNCKQGSTYCYLPEIGGKQLSVQTETHPPRIDDSKLKYHGCVKQHYVCFDQGRSILFSGVKTPRSPAYTEDLFDPGFTWLNIPGYADNFVGTKTKTPWPQFRANSSADPPDIAAPRFSASIVPLIWWPIWAENYGEVVLQSLAPLHAMQADGLVDRNVTLVPVLNGFRLPDYFQWLLQPFTNNRIETFEDLSSREHMHAVDRTRCFHTVLFCKTLNLFNYRDEGLGKTHWYQALKPGSLGQELVKYYRPLMKVPIKDPTIIKVAIVLRVEKRRLLNMDELVQACNAFQPADASSSMDCFVYDFDSPGVSFLQHLEQLQMFDIMIGVHGAALANGIFMRPGTAVVEVRPCQFDSDWIDNYFQRVHRIENINLAYKIITVDPSLCSPGDLEQSGDRSGLDLSWVELSFKRDQDITLKPATLTKMLDIIINLHQFDSITYERLAKQEPTWFNTISQ